MAKKHSRSSSTPKKPMELATTSKKPLEEVPSTSKRPLEVATTPKKPLDEVASTSKKQKRPLLNAPPEALSNDEEMETEEEGDETNSSSEEEDEPKEPVKTPSAPNVAATVIQSSGSESGSETESGESDSETEPASTKPPPPLPAPVASPRTLRKRTIEVTVSTDVNANKRAKTEAGETDNTAKKALFQRVWSEEDEVALLQGTLEFKNVTGKNPSDDFNGLYEMVKGSSNFEGKSLKQFTGKLGKLKEKYLRKNKSFKKPHDLICLELANKIWGTDIVSSAAVVKSKKKMKVEDDDSKRVDGVSDWFERSSLVGALTNMGLVDDESVKSKWNLVSVENKKKLEEKWKLLVAGDFEHLAEKTKFLVEVSSVIANAN